MCPNRSHAKEGLMRAERKACSTADGVVKNEGELPIQNQSILPNTLASCLRTSAPLYTPKKQQQPITQYTKTKKPSPVNKGWLSDSLLKAGV
jgi:hypothetical protein